jgi:hypothetical protein
MEIKNQDTTSMAMIRTMEDSGQLQPHRRRYFIKPLASSLRMILFVCSISQYVPWTSRMPARAAGHAIYIRAFYQPLAFTDMTYF